MLTYDLTKVENMETGEISMISIGGINIDNDQKPYEWWAELHDLDNVDMFHEIISDKQIPLLDFTTEKHGVLEGKAFATKVVEGTRGPYVRLQGTGPLNQNN